MQHDVHIEVEARDTRGKNAARRLRVGGKVPAVVYGGDRDPVAIQVDRKTLDDFIRKTRNEHAVFLLDRLLGLGIDDQVADPVAGLLVDDVEADAAAGRRRRIKRDRTRHQRQLEVALPGCPRRHVVSPCARHALARFGAGRSRANSSIAAQGSPVAAARAGSEA